MIKPGIQETGLDGVITEFGLALIGTARGECLAAGSAVIIGQNLALTAKHVIDECWRYFGEDRKLKFGDLHGDFGLIAQQVLAGNRGALWAIRKVWRSPHTDLAAIQIEPHSELARKYNWRCPLLKVQPPALGSKVSCFGYLNGEVSAKTEDDHTSISFLSSPSTAVGTVVELHSRCRDRGMLSFPCFQTNAPFSHGMSGGPIFVDGALSGIVCASGLTDKEGNRIAYGATLWPLLATTVDIHVAGESPNSSFSMYDLAARRIIRVTDLESFTVRHNQDGVQILSTNFAREIGTSGHVVASNSPNSDLPNGHRREVSSES